MVHSYIKLSNDDWDNENESNKQFLGTIGKEYYRPFYIVIVKIQHFNDYVPT